ncbi:tonsoku-like protein [Homalodisca vitripennis]|uniref:tonsoku-like protein n=1 Tax=Homalodisca vitripennis TaxID=197043 RepID=UPI001EECB5F6|nr:tonsoku-like protein [Homalodisca vitripennis]
MSFQKWRKKKEKAINEGNLDELFLACSELAELYTSKEEFENALEEYKEAKRAAEAANNTINVAVAHRMIGEVYSSMQKYDFGRKTRVEVFRVWPGRRMTRWRSRELLQTSATCT